MNDPPEKKLDGGFWTRLLGHIPVICIGFGAFFLLLAATGGFTAYGAPLQVAEAEWRYFSAGAGLMLIVSGLGLALREARPAAPRVPSLKTVDVTFNAVAEGLTVRLWGIARRVPDGFDLWVMQLSGDGRARRYWPRGAVSPARDGTWEMHLRYAVLPHPPHKTFSLFLVGPDGQRLIHFFQIAGQRLREAGGADWPGIPELTDDTRRCADEEPVELFEITHGAAPAPARPRAGRPASPSGRA